MPQNAFDVQKARQDGYSDDEILQHLTESRGFDVQKALKDGYSKGDIIDHLSSTPSQPQKEGFFSSAAHALGIPTSKEEAVNAVSSAVGSTDPATGLLASAVEGIASRAKGGFQRMMQATRNIQQGQPILPNIAQGARGIFGMETGAVLPQVERAGEQISEGNYRGAAGTVAGTLAPVAAVPAARAIRNIPGPLELVERAPVVGKTIQDVHQALTAPENLAPEQAFIKATKPRNSIVDAKGKIQQALPDARRAADSLGIDPKTMTLEDAERAVGRAKTDVWGEYEQRFLGPNKNAPIDVNPVADRIKSVESNMSDIQRQRLTGGPHGGGPVDELRQAAADYEGKTISMDQVEKRIQELNNELRSQQSQFKVNEMALRRDPRFSGKFAELDGLRQVEANSFEQLSGPGAPFLKQRYGALKVMEDVLQRRINVAERQAPVSLTQAMGRMYGVGKIAKGALTLSPGDVAEGMLANRVAKVSRLNNDADFLIQQAFSKTTPRPTATILPTSHYQPPTIRGLLPRGAIQLGSEMEPIENVGPMAQPAMRSTGRDVSSGRFQRTYTSQSAIPRAPVLTWDPELGRAVVKPEPRLPSVSGGSEPQWPAAYQNAPRTLTSEGGGGANYTAADLEAFKAKHGIQATTPAGEDFIEQLRRGGSEPPAEAYPINQVPREQRASTEIVQAANQKLGERISGRSATKQDIEQGGEKLPSVSGGSGVPKQRPLPEMPPVPEQGQYPAIQTDDGAVYVDTSGKAGNTHVKFAQQMGIPSERIVSGGWVNDGVYEGSVYSDAGRYGERARAQLRASQKRSTSQSQSESSSQGQALDRLLKNSKLKRDPKTGKLIKE